MDPYYGVIDHRNPYSNVFTGLVEAVKIWCGQTVYRRIFLLMSLLIIKNIPHIHKIINIYLVQQLT